MYLCIMRHGKAEPFKTDKIDADRMLTEAGEQQCEQMASLAKKWWPAGKSSLWVSPYIRACQTAAYLKKYISFDSFHTHQAIADGNLDVVYTDILSREKSEIVCLVGHSPFIDKWAEAWTGYFVDYKPGSMALYEYDPFSGKAGTGKLLMYVHPKAGQLLHRI
jgi:phosphohistidine phosphatase